MDHNQPQKRICLGKIADAHGVKGLVKIFPYGDDLSLLSGTLYQNETGQDTLEITLKNPLGKFILAEIKDVQDRTHAETLKGTKLFIDRALLPDIEGGHYFEDLAGMPVTSDDGENMGKVIAVENFGASDLLEIQGPKGTFYLPFTEDFTSVETDHITIKDFEQFL